ncbi:MAG: hypothetical protein H6R00_1673 [Proteobacteria bacterium]|nr:hypothetical protein [Pseudomonadota bacterium]
MLLANEIDFVEMTSGDVIMINLINAAADILNRETYLALTEKNFSALDAETADKLLARRYAFESDEDYQRFIAGLDNEIEDMEIKSVPNFVLIPSYACNLKCIYCYEQTYKINNRVEHQRSTVNDWFDFIGDRIADLKIRGADYDPADIMITLMGGEPLLRSNYNTIEDAVNQIESIGYSYCVVSNGVDIEQYIDLLRDKNVDHIQITLDGDREIHDARRIFHDGSGSFDIIMDNIGKCLRAGLKIVVRVNVDAGNLKGLPDLSRLLAEKFGTFGNFSAYIYLLHDGGCSGESNVVDEEIGIDEVYAIEQENPTMSIFKKSFHPTNFVESILKDRKFNPALRHCGAAMNQYVLDAQGRVYKCWHGIGNNEYIVGTIRNGLGTLSDFWLRRAVNRIEECKQCKYRYICGTGCPASGHNDKAGAFNVASPSCVKYGELIKKLVGIELGRQ